MSGGAVYPYVYREHVNRSAMVKNNARFIPMCIGNTPVRINIPPTNSVYPYVYREHFSNVPGGASFFGLSLCV